MEELHPLLMDLFNNIKEITNVEYTHGSKEMGADIILNRNDSVLGVEEYIAIVAKAVPIKQDFTDVQRQDWKHVLCPFIYGEKAGFFGAPAH